MAAENRDFGRFLTYRDNFHCKHTQFFEFWGLLKKVFLRGGGGVHPDYFVKLDFEIAVDQQTKARDRTFEGVPDSG